MIGKPLLNVNSCDQAPVQTPRGQFVPARLTNTALPPGTSGLSGRLLFFESCASRARLNESVKFHLALNPTEFSWSFCMLFCCSKPKSFPPTISRRKEGVATAELVSNVRSVKLLLRCSQIVCSPRFSLSLFWAYV